MKDNQLNYIVGGSFEDMDLGEITLTEGLNVEGRIAISTIAISAAKCVATATAAIGLVSAWVTNN